MLPTVQKNAAAAHALMPELILEGGVFEIVTKAGVESLPIPAYVFRAFNLQPIARHFNFSGMLFPDGT
jgi:hypothetical protein